jgi:hypothetical protein
MQILSPNALQFIMDWLLALPYPWCPVLTALASAPRVDGVKAILDYIQRMT